MKSLPDPRSRDKLEGNRGQEHGEGRREGGRGVAVTSPKASDTKPD